MFYEPASGHILCPSPEFVTRNFTAKLQWSPLFICPFNETGAKLTLLLCAFLFNVVVTFGLLHLLGGRQF
jgi:hypothetical protein